MSVVPYCGHVIPKKEDKKRKTLLVYCKKDANREDS